LKGAGDFFEVIDSIFIPSLKEPVKASSDAQSPHVWLDGEKDNRDEEV
jgi:hypothetical protein